MICLFCDYLAISYLFTYFLALTGFEWNNFRELGDCNFNLTQLSITNMKDNIPNYWLFPKKNALNPIEYNRQNFEHFLLSSFDTKLFCTISAQQNWRIYDSDGNLIVDFFCNKTPEVQEITAKFTSFMDSLPPELFATSKTVRRFDVGAAVHFGYHFYNPRHDEKCGRKKGETYIVEYKELKNH